MSKWVSGAEENSSRQRRTARAANSISRVARIRTASIYIRVASDLRWKNKWRQKPARQGESLFLAPRPGQKEVTRAASVTSRAASRGLTGEPISGRTRF